MNRNFYIPVLFSSGFLVLQIVLGGLISTGGLVVSNSWILSVHRSLALISLAVIITLAVISVKQLGQIKENLIEEEFLSPINHARRRIFENIALTTLLTMFILLVSGTLISSIFYSNQCASWPLCNGSVRNWDLNIWMNNGHRFFVLFTGLMIAILNIEAWRKYKNNPTILTLGTLAAVLFLAQSLMGGKMVSGFPNHLVLLHQLTAVAVWIALVILNVVVGMGVQPDPIGKKRFFSYRWLVQRISAFFKLTKPIVVALLLVTTFAGMVISQGKWPPLNTTLWTLLAGFLAAGGSSAINQYIDRHDDQKMQRTQKRPIPAGVITPAEGLAFGAAAATASFFIMTAFVNFLAALLTLAGIIYYVLLYSIILKKATIQNIVIGGGAGAIPPLVGWAAVTNSLNVPSLFLFAIIFVWTPPHFWALALTRKKDYARAGVPMLPVVRGEKETRWQIFIYTIELVALTMLLPLFGLGGAIYIIGAALLGLWLISTAWRVWKKEGNKVAWKMYRYSSMYLAFLFFILMIDRLV